LRNGTAEKLSFKGEHLPLAATVFDALVSQCYHKNYQFDDHHHDAAPTEAWRIKQGKTKGRTFWNDLHVKGKLITKEKEEHKFFLVARFCGLRGSLC
jgi:hypothetical protein